MAFPKTNMISRNSAGNMRAASCWNRMPDADAIAQFGKWFDRR